LDHFKAYNDTYGFKKGDEVLQATADLLKRTFEKTGIFLGHIGGDDFIAVLNHAVVVKRKCKKIKGSCCLVNG
jgi:diguanylate cyclase (GGDEF)-like protein